MRAIFVKRIIAVAIPALAIFLLAPDRSTTASFDRQTAPPQDKTAEQVYKNIQVLNGVPAAGLMRGMNFFTKSLGVDCTHCHVPNEFEKDDKPAKLTARKMYRMSQLVRKELNVGKVTCYTCHRGHVQPAAPKLASEEQIKKMQEEAEKDKRPSQEVYKNVQVLKGVPAGRWTMIMTMFSKSLGVDCTYCHVEGAYEKDDKPAKETARKMLRLTGTIYREIYEGKNSPVNCYTCHRGQTQIVSVPSQ
ncbi:MAG TPA: photosynthetic reaction center cytochrome c subunit family protein [Blastocatellia bacterium]|nr:photosynthetic reaction center cytochrome c subunit family protein [Blastocatellia bacterium]